MTNDTTTLRQAASDRAAHALDDARLYLTRAYAANDPEMREVVNLVVGQTIATVCEALIAAAREGHPACLEPCSLDPADFELRLDDWITKHLTPDAPVPAALPWWMTHLPEGWEFATERSKNGGTDWYAEVEGHEVIGPTRDEALNAALRAALEVTK